MNKLILSFFFIFLVSLSYASAESEDQFFFVPINTTLDCWVEGGNGTCFTNISIKSDSTNNPKDYKRNRIQSLNEEGFNIVIEESVQCKDEKLAETAIGFFETVCTNEHGTEVDCITGFIDFKRRWEIVVEGKKTADEKLSTCRTENEGLATKDKRIAELELEISIANKRTTDTRKEKDDLEKSKTNSMIIVGLLTGGAVWWYHKKDAPQSGREGHLRTPEVPTQEKVPDRLKDIADKFLSDKEEIK